MKANTSFLIIVLALISCDPNDDYNSSGKMTSLLTSTPWMASPPQTASESFRKGTFHFKPDGTYVEDYSNEAEKYYVTGTWQWTDSEELLVIHKSIISNEEILPLDIQGEVGTVRKIKILQLNDEYLTLTTWGAMDPQARGSDKEKILLAAN